MILTKLFKLVKWVFSLALILLISQLSAAQVVNIEKKRKENKEGFAGVLDLGFSMLDNGKKIRLFKNNIDLQYNKGKSTFIILNELNLMTVDNDNLINSGFQHLRYNYTIRDSGFITVEAFAQHQYNALKLLKKRILTGLGPRLKIIDSKKLSCYIGLLGMYEYEELTDSLKTITEYVRLGSYISFNWDITDNLFFNNTTYYQPAFKYLMNYRISSETNFQLKITKFLSFKIGLQSTYDTNPPENIQKLFYLWENVLSYEF